MLLNFLFFICMFGCIVTRGNSPVITCWTQTQHILTPMFTYLVLFFFLLLPFIRYFVDIEFRSLCALWQYHTLKRCCFNCERGRQIRTSFQCWYGTLKCPGLAGLIAALTNASRRAAAAQSWTEVTWSADVRFVHPSRLSGKNVALKVQKPSRHRRVLRKAETRAASAFFFLFFKLCWHSDQSRTLSSCLTPLPSPLNPSFIGRLFVCGDVLVSAQSFRIFFFCWVFLFCLFFSLFY